MKGGLYIATINRARRSESFYITEELCKKIEELKETEAELSAKIEHYRSPAAPAIRVQGGKAQGLDGLLDQRERVQQRLHTTEELFKKLLAEVARISLELVLDDSARGDSHHAFILIQRYVNGLSVAEIAERENLPKAKIQRFIKQALRFADKHQGQGTNNKL